MAETECDEIDHHHSDEHKRQQAEYFDHQQAVEFEIERPRGTPRLYGWLLSEKMRRALAGLESISGSTVLTVCGGSGMDAEFLAKQGAKVIVTDISKAAAERCRQRAERHGVSLWPVVADIEHLPFPDRSIDVVLVHDGLHHLRNPLAGLREMARVASRAVSINEPAQAWVTRLATHVGLALTVEEAGNTVARMSAGEVLDVLAAEGFSPTCTQRYGMFYRHKPGRMARLFSAPGAFIFARAFFASGNKVAGRFGNKLTIQAVRS